MPNSSFSPTTGALHLDKLDPANTGNVSREEAEAKLLTLRNELDELSTLLYADRRRALLVVLHGIDASGKDGTIRWLASGVGPIGFAVHAYKAPDAEELAQDFLWRVHRNCPPRGTVGVFNRSHYEEVTTVRVHPEYLERQGLPAEIASDSSIWKKRFRQIRDFERMLVDNGTTVLKFLLHVSPKEQLERLNERMEDPHKRWKHNPGDFEERKRWDEYMRTFEAMVEGTAAPEAPWYVVPADRKWYRNYVVGSVVVETLRKLKMEWPK